MCSTAPARVTAAALGLLSIGLVAAAPAAKGGPGREAKAGQFPLARATPEEVKAWLGEPAVANDEGKGAFWTYRLEDCALMVFFKNEGAGLRVSGVAAGPRRRADVAPDAETCIADAKR